MSETFLVESPTQFATGDGIKSSFAVGAYDQIVKSISVSTVRRVDWQGNTLLTTDMRTNMAIRSQEFGSPAWTKTGTTIPSEMEVSPDGTITADSVVESMGGVAAVHAVSRSYLFVAGTRYVTSVFAKEFASGIGAKRYLVINFASASFGVGYVACFDLAIGQLVSAPAGITATMTLVGGFYKCSISAVATSTSTSSSQFRLSSSFSATNQQYVGDGVSGLYLWGAQLEIGAAPTAYIPTLASPVTVVDYSVAQPDSIAFGQIPVIGARLLWTGQYEYERVAQPVNLAVVTVASQYANSPTIMQLIDCMRQYFDPRADVKAFYDYVWNVDTAQGFGLDIWGRIVGVDRNLTVPDESAEYFGFKEGDGEPFGQQSFYNGQPTTTTYTLDDTGYRTLILVKALSNISICSAQSINQQLRNLFPGRGRCYVNDFRDMTMRLTFEFELTSYEIAILTQSNAITRPAAVEIMVSYSLNNKFGFKEGDGEPFGQGTFYKP